MLVISCDTFELLAVSGGSKKGTFEVDLFKVLTIKGLADEKLVFFVFKRARRAVKAHNLRTPASKHN